MPFVDFSFCCVSDKGLQKESKVQVWDLQRQDASCLGSWGLQLWLLVPEASGIDQLWGEDLEFEQPLFCLQRFVMVSENKVDRLLLAILHISCFYIFVLDIIASWLICFFLVWLVFCGNLKSSSILWKLHWKFCIVLVKIGLWVMFCVLKWCQNLFVWAAWGYGCLVEHCLWVVWENWERNI